MPVDLNDLSGFISSCDNGPYLYDLWAHVGERLRQIGYAPPAASPMPAPATPQAVRLVNAIVAATPEAAPAAPPPDIFLGRQDTPALPLVRDESDPLSRDMPDYSMMPPPLRLQLEEGHRKRVARGMADQDEAGEGGNP